MRADAVRNRERLLAAARDTFVELGVDAALDEVARRAGIGIATLYRRFPDRRALMNEVALEVLTQAAVEARAAMVAEPDSFRALARYLHRALDIRIAAVMPVLSDEIAVDRDPRLGLARDDLGALFQSMVDTAKREGLLRTDVDAGDLGLMVIRVARPLPLPVDRAFDDSLAHRQLDVLLDGLRAPGAPGTAGLTLDDVRRIGRNGPPR